MRLRQEESPISLESKNRSIVRSIRIEVYTEYLCWCSSVDVRGINSSGITYWKYIGDEKVTRVRVRCLRVSTLSK